MNKTNKIQKEQNEQNHSDQSVLIYKTQNEADNDDPRTKVKDVFHIVDIVMDHLFHSVVVHESLNGIRDHRRITGSFVTELRNKDRIQSNVDDR